MPSTAILRANHYCHSEGSMNPCSQIPTKPRLSFRGCNAPVESPAFCCLHSKLLTKCHKTKSIIVDYLFCKSVCYHKRKTPWIATPTL